ncbi:hypothetical protein V0288_14945 [Pannus brasiliensis CCIBt3594]|uniref:Uncharacterized protein n=1 Tax=Pannus brasiliensis CCIBt3594 TaxID=1427578 RepID=A0AAW9QY27_9CHRO
MSGKAKGKRPVYLSTAENDRLLAILMALAGEVAVVRERLDSIERLLDSRGTISRQDLESYQPDETVFQEREKWRQEYLARLLRILEEEK